MSKFHISPATGEPKACRAHIRECPVGGEHYGSEAEARAAFESGMAGVNSWTTYDSGPLSAKTEEAPKVNARTQMSNRVASLKNALRDFADKAVIDEPEKTAIAAGLLTAMVVGGGFAAYHASQDYSPTNSGVVNSQVHHHTQAITTGKTTTVTQTTDTEVQVHPDDAPDSTVTVTVQGSHDYEAGEALQVYNTGDGDYTAVRPDSAAQYGYDALGGVLGGSIAGVAALAGSMPLSDYLASRRSRRRYA